MVLEQTNPLLEERLNESTLITNASLLVGKQVPCMAIERTDYDSKTLIMRDA